MGKINILGFDVANLIAAGEVVDRPSSVVKELLENAIDSGADKITVEIKNGGTTFIRIADNGCGIDFDDLPVALLRHATSKIKDASDLDSIFTLGFRGEALAAISSVSKIRIMSKTPGQELGGLIEAEGGKIISHIKTGCADGTTVIVEDLFYNVPARKKFLKKDMTEGMAITSVVEKIAMSKPGISFRYIMDGDIKYLTAGDGNLSNVIYAILGKDIAKKSIKVSRGDSGIKVEGYISSPELVRANRNSENFYINSRFVKSKTASAAIEQAFNSYIPSDKFPFCTLNIEIDPLYVDVNVHPSKLEVKFSNEKLIFDAVYYAVRTALETSIKRPSMYNEPICSESLANTPFPIKDREVQQPKVQKIGFDKNGNIGVVRSNNTLDYASYEKERADKLSALYGKNSKSEEKTTDKKPYINTYASADGTCCENDAKKASVTDVLNAMADFASRNGAENIVPELKSEEPKASIEETKFPTDNEVIPLTKEAETEAPLVSNNQKNIATDTGDKKKTVPDYKIVGEVFNSYVIVELGDIMYMIDKHAAHERIIFEDLKKKIKGKEPSGQILMLPIEIHLTSEELGALDEWQNEIKQAGFDFVKKAGGVSIIEIPTGIEASAAADMFETFLYNLINSSGFAKETRDEFFEKALYQASCKAAIKAGRIYDASDIKWIVDRVLTFDNIKFCPHGRPVAFEITKHFLEKQFERIK